MNAQRKERETARTRRTTQMRTVAEDPKGAEKVVQDLKAARIMKPINDGAAKVEKLFKGEPPPWIRD